MAFVLSGLFHAGMRDVIVIALTAERIPAALGATVRTDRCSAIGTVRDGELAARHPVVAIAGDVFNLAVHCSNSAQASSQERQPGTGSL
jgi:hypothetical protein